MTELLPNTAKVEKICLDNECAEQWEKHADDQCASTSDFVYCPYCSEELHLQCSSCKEALTSKDFRFCPWCGAQFEE